jgi:hypothetical protein
MEEWIMEVRAMLRGQLNEVFENAKDLGNRYLQDVMDTNKGKDWSQKNTLEFRVRMNNNKSAISIEWYSINWHGKKETGRTKRREYIPKRNKSRRRDSQVYSYCMDDLLLHTVGWDIDLVEAVEAEASQYRRQAHYLSDMLVTLGRLERFMAGGVPESPIEEEQ